jgi:hypothetical protein
MLSKLNSPSLMNHCRSLALTAMLALGVTSVYAGVLPEDRADALYHRFDGGDVTVDGPSILVRKKFGEQISASANYFVDMVTSASIDVQTSGASEYKEERTQISGSLDYLRGKTTYNLSFIDSKESDYTAQTASIGISEDMFGDLTTVTIGYSRAWDNVFKNFKDPTTQQVIRDNQFEEKGVDHRFYRLGLSQIVTKHLIMGLNYESQSHEGYLQNPYRSIRFLLPDGTEGSGEEIYPNTRTTNAASINARYYLPWRAAANASYRFFADTWGIKANTFELGYTHPWGERWIFEGSYRLHSQDHADFYSDLFARRNQQNFMARDRNLATLTNRSFRLGVTYTLPEFTRWLEKSTLNLYVDSIQIEFDDFRDARTSKQKFKDPPDLIGGEPMYIEKSTVVRFFFSVWF